MKGPDGQHPLSHTLLNWDSCTSPEHAEDVGWAASVVLLSETPPHSPSNKNLLFPQIMLCFRRKKKKRTGGMAHEISHECPAQPCGELMFRAQLTCHTQSPIVFGAVMPD